MKNDLISIIIPVYKVEKYLEKCIESVLKQTYTNLQIILVHQTIVVKFVMNMQKKIQELK